MAPIRIIPPPARRLLGLSALALACAVAGAATDAPRAASSAPASGAAPGGTAPAATPGGTAPAASRGTAPAVTGGALAAPMSAEEVIRVLDQTVDWYRTLGVQQQAATEPSDLLILYENRQITNQVVGLAFDAARADADLLARQPTPPDPGQQPTSSQTLAQLQKKLDAQQSTVQGELDSAKLRLGAGNAREKADLRAKVSELQGELELIGAKKNILDSIGGFQSGSGAPSGAGALRAQIDAMAVALPSMSTVPLPAASASSASGHSSPAAAAPAASFATTAASSANSRFGLWDLVANVFRLSEKASIIEGVDRRTAELKGALTQVRGRLVGDMRALSAQGDALMSQADTADSGALNGVRNQLDALVDRLKQASAIFVPLSKQLVLLDQYHRNLMNWRDAVVGQTHEALKVLGIRVGVLLAILAVVFTLADLWRRAVLRYIQDARRRYQLMLLRRIALWSLVVVIVGFAFASELSSIVTFAGLITAGLAVAMQSVLVSIVGYFFLIGKYGIRVGDRVQIGDVQGEIIDIGLVRMYLMEYARGSAVATGRVVAFANSVVFQVSSGLFKQIPGINLTWHDITLSMPAGVDYALAKKKLYTAAVDSLADYREEIQRQTRELQRTTSSNTGGDALPTVQLSYSVKGVDAHVRYPVHLPHAAEIDERMSRSLLQAISELTPKDRAVAPSPP